MQIFVGMMGYVRADNRSCRDENDCTICKKGCEREVCTLDLALPRVELARQGARVFGRLTRKPPAPALPPRGDDRTMELEEEELENGLVGKLRVLQIALEAERVKTRRLENAVSDQAGTSSDFRPQVINLQVCA